MKNWISGKLNSLYKYEFSIEFRNILELGLNWWTKYIKSF